MRSYRTPKVHRWRVPLLRRLARRPLLWWALVLIGAVWTSVTASQILAEAERERSSWGERTSVLWASSEITNGDQLAGDVELVEVPSWLVPAGALAVVDGAATAAVDIGAGEILTGRRVTGALPTLDNLPPGVVSVAVPTGAGVDAPAGARVDLLATFNPPPGQLPSDQDTVAVASGATVLSVAEDTVTVALAQAEAAAVAGALSRASITVVVVGPR